MRTVDKPTLKAVGREALFHLVQHLHSRITSRHSELERATDLAGLMRAQGAVQEMRSIIQEAEHLIKGPLED